MKSLRRTADPEPPQVWRAADVSGPPPSSHRKRESPPAVLRRRRWVILGLTVLTVALLVLICTVSGLLVRGLFTAMAVVAVLLAGFLAVANLPELESAARPTEPSPTVGRPKRRNRNDISGPEVAGAVNPKVQVQAVETSSAEIEPTAGEQPPRGVGPQAPAQVPAPTHAQAPAPASYSAPPAPASPVPDPRLPARLDLAGAGPGQSYPAAPGPDRPAPAAAVAVRQPSDGGPPATAGQAERYDPQERQERPPVGYPDEPGRFPVLRKPSAAATAPWLLPAAPSAAAITADEAVLGGLRLRAASVSGPSHRSRGIPRQDAYRIGQDSAGRHLVVAVADGMSDSKHSDLGAGAAVIALVNTLRELLDRGIPLQRINVREVFLAAARQMYGAAEQRGWTADEVRAVALAAVIPAQPDPDGVRRCWLGAIGDVSAWRLVHRHWERLIGDEKGGLDPSAVAHFLPHDVDHLPYGVVEMGPGEVMGLTTDGVADAFALGPDAQQWFAERWRQPPPVGAFLLDVGFEQAQLQDDRTAVVVWCADTPGTAAKGRQR
jgi:hypothetical protein